jgi:hypothetical protein
MSNVINAQQDFERRRWSGQTARLGGLLTEHSAACLRSFARDALERRGNQLPLILRSARALGARDPALAARLVVTELFCESTGFVP